MNTIRNIFDRQTYSYSGYYKKAIKLYNTILDVYSNNIETPVNKGVALKKLR